MKHARSTDQNPKGDPPEAKRIVIVDDHPLFRKGLAELIHSEKNHFAVCGEAGNAAGHDGDEILESPCSAEHVRAHVELVAEERLQRLEQPTR